MRTTIWSWWTKGLAIWCKAIKRVTHHSPILSSLILKRNTANQVLFTWESFTDSTDRQAAQLFLPKLPRHSQGWINYSLIKKSLKPIGQRYNTRPKRLQQHWYTGLKRIQKTTRRLCFIRSTAMPNGLFCTTKSHDPWTATVFCQSLLKQGVIIKLGHNWPLLVLQLRAISNTVLTAATPTGGFICTPGNWNLFTR